MTRKQWWGLGVGISIWALFLTQGLTLWDDDFTSWIKRYQDRATWLLFWDVISPLSTQPESWGFNERPVQMILYRLAGLISGDAGWAFFLIKSLTIAAMGLGVAAWVDRLSRASSRSVAPAILAAIWAVTSGVTAAALVWHPDYAPLAEAWFLWSSLLLWALTERAYEESRVAPHQWLFAAAVCVVGYKVKADLKLLPAIWISYLLFFPKLKGRWRAFALPLGIMIFYVVPWGRQVVTALPPFVPGSSGSQVGWMWQPASLDRLKDFFWLREGWNFSEQVFAPTLALLWNVPLVLLAAIGFLFWRTGGVLDRVPWFKLTQAEDRGRLWILIWLSWITLGVTALPAINYTFRVRYGILLWAPLSVLLGIGIGFVARAWRENRMPRALQVVLVTAFALQLGLNGWKAFRVRRDMGAVMVSVDRAFRAIDERYPLERLVLLPDFRPYDSRPTSSPAVRDAAWLKSNEEIRAHVTSTKVTVALSWNPSFWEELDFEELLSGCPGGVIFDAILPCRQGEGAYLYRYIGTNPDYQRGEVARKRGAHAEALSAYQKFIAQYPRNFAGHFVLGLTALAIGDHPLARKSWAYLETYFPHHLSVVYNLALAEQGLGQWDDARKRFIKVIAADDKNYGAWFHLCSGWIRTKKWGRARRALDDMERRFPGDREITRMRGELAAQ